MSARKIGDPRAWLRAQLKGGAPTLRAPAEATPEALTEAIRAFRSMAQATNETARQPARQDARRRLVEIAAAESRQALAERVTTARPFVERLVAFWSNHLCISTGAKVLVAPLAGSYEREAIRPHVLGRFEDMLLASAKHPAMLVYLDNLQSIGPNSPAARAGGRGRGAARGLNENYARELLELHTLGVDGGYTQQDVQELAKMLTGWSVGGLAPERQAALRSAFGRGRGRAAMVPRPTDHVEFVFQPLLHEPGAKTLLGVRYQESGQDEAERAIRALCSPPVYGALRGDETRPALRQRRTAGRRRRSHRAPVPRDRRRSRRRRRDARRSARSVDGRRAQVPHAAGLARRDAPRVQRLGRERA